MGLISRSIVAASAAVGLAVVSQAPEFAQQYRQRLGGAVDELQTVVTDFDHDAERSGMTRDDALTEMQGAQTGLVRDRGASMQRTVERFETLSGQLDAFETAAPMEKPLIVLRNPDPQVVGAAWQVFEPAVPITLPGLVYGGAGALLLAALARFGIGAGRSLRRRRKRIRITGDAGQNL